MPSLPRQFLPFNEEAEKQRLIEEDARLAHLDELQYSQYLQSNQCTQSKPITPSKAPVSNGGIGDHPDDEAIRRVNERAMVLNVMRLARKHVGTSRKAPSDRELRAIYASNDRLSDGKMDFLDFRLMFTEALRTAKPVTDGSLAEAVAKARLLQVPANSARYGKPQIDLIMNLCSVLQSVSGRGPFFLAANSVAAILGVSRPTISRWLRLLVLDGVLELARPGHTGRAAEYRFIGFLQEGEIGGDIPF